MFRRRIGRTRSARSRRWIRCRRCGGQRGIRSRPGWRRRQFQITENDVHIFNVRPAGEDSDQEGIKFPPERLPGKFIAWTALNPAERQIIGHTDRVTSVFEKKQIGYLREPGHELSRFLGRGDDLHGMEAVEFVDRLDFDELSSRKKADPVRRRPEGSEPVAPEPGLVGSQLHLRVDDRRVVRPALHHPGQVIDIIIARRRDRLENELPGLAVDGQRTDIFNPLAGRRIDEDHVFLLGVGIPAPPGEARQYRIRLLQDSDDRPMIAVDLGIPCPCAVPDFFAGGPVRLPDQSR